MRNRSLFFFVVFLMILFVFFKLDHLLREKVLSLGDEVKMGILDTKEWMIQTYESYFDQAKTIKRQNQELKELEKIKLKNTEIQSELDSIVSFYAMPKPRVSDLYVIRAISYVDFGNYERVWLKGYEREKEGFFGLLAQGSVIGIAKQDSNGRLIGYLNGDSLCSYGVYVGKNKALGIVRGIDHQLLIDYIPLGSEIEIGDEVITNGLDDIFFSNLPVGKVSEVILQNGYLSAKITPYVQKIQLGYLWLLDRKK